MLEKTFKILAPLVSAVAVIFCSSNYILAADINMTNPTYSRDGDNITIEWQTDDVDSLQCGLYIDDSSNFNSPDIMHNKNTTACVFNYDSNPNTFSCTASNLNLMAKKFYYKVRCSINNSPTAIYNSNIREIEERDSDFAITNANLILQKGHYNVFATIKNIGSNSKISNGTITISTEVVSGSATDNLGSANLRINGVFAGGQKKDVFLGEIDVASVITDLKTKDKVVRVVPKITDSTFNDLSENNDGFYKEFRTTDNKGTIKAEQYPDFELYSARIKKDGSNYKLFAYVRNIGKSIPAGTAFDYRVITSISDPSGASLANTAIDSGDAAGFSKTRVQMNDFGIITGIKAGDRVKINVRLETDNEYENKKNNSKDINFVINDPKISVKEIYSKMEGKGTSAKMFFYAKIENLGIDYFGNVVPISIAPTLGNGILMLGSKSSYSKTMTEIPYGTSIIKLE